MNDEGPAESETHRRLETELGRLRDRAAEMGRWALGMVHDGWRAFRDHDLALAQEVLDRDTELDRYDQEVEHAVIAFLVTRQPAAGDLRAATALLKATTHLDRVGRLGFDMARITTAAEGHDVPAALLDLLDTMDGRAEAIVADALAAMQQGDAERARALLPRDDEVDRLHREATRQIVGELARDPTLAQRLSGTLLVARHFERISDNACKVSERTIYAATGQRRAEYLPRHPYHPYALEGGAAGGGGTPPANT
jgi:phosphate transport system protein